jgi:hypothetical protein
MGDSFPRSKTGWGKKLFEALTRDQVETLLDGFARNGDLFRLAEELRAVDLDLADTVQRLLRDRTSEKLFAEWRNTVVGWCVPYHRLGEQAADSWVYWLIEARRNPLTHRQVLLDHLKIWLARFPARAAFFRENWQSLALMTRSLPSAEELKAVCPAFHAHVLTAKPTLEATLQKSLREALTLVRVETTDIKPMPIWREHLHLLVPSPASGGSYYKDHALWMKALSEVNRLSYNGIIAEWKALHRRRRNLWAEMAALNLPGL